MIGRGLAAFFVLREKTGRVPRVQNPGLTPCVRRGELGAGALAPPTLLAPPSSDPRSLIPVPCSLLFRRLQIISPPRRTILNRKDCATNMKNITVSVSDKAYKDARVWAAANSTSVSAAVQVFIETLPRAMSSPDNASLINRRRQQARAKDKSAAQDNAAAQHTRSAVPQPGPSGPFSPLLKFFLKTTQKLHGRESLQQNQ